MSAKSPNERIIFGLKVKQLRQEKRMSFAELAKVTGMSVSYLNEIEKGKKYPKADKVSVLASALEIPVSELVSTELDASLAPVEELLQSNFLNELPLDMFGIELNKVAELIASAPLRVGAFISTLLELSRNYAVREENFFFAALRAYLELHNNYFEDIEEAVERFTALHKIPASRPLQPEVLGRLLEIEYGYEIVDAGLDEFDELRDLRSVFIPNKKQLLLNGQLTTIQRSFQFGKELAFKVLSLNERAYTSSLLRGRVFEEVINHAYATYFSVALHLPLHPFISDMRSFFAAERWDGEAFLSIMNRYNATPEMFYHRLTNVVPRYFNMPKIFFLRFIHDPAQNTFEVDKELHLNRRHHPHGNGLFEHYCRRWVSLSLLKDLGEMQSEGKYVSTIVRAQRSRYFGTADEYLCLTLARPGLSGPIESGATVNKNVSVTLGLLVNDDVRKQIKWLNDPAIQVREVNKTCERCALRDCEERAAEPIIIQRKERFRAIQQRLKHLDEN